MKSPAGFLFLFLALVSTGETQTHSTEEIIQSVVRDNPTIKSARARWEGMKERVPQLRAWEDPMIGADFERRSTTRFNTYSDIEYMVSQPVPLSGKNLSRARIADAEAAAVYADLRRAELDAVSAARVAGLALSAAYAQLTITNENEQLLKQFADISRVKYEAARQSQSDLLLAQVDLARISQTGANLEREISDRESQLNVLMNRPARSPVGKPGFLQYVPLKWEASTIEAQALAHRPELQRAQQTVQAAQSRLQLARREWIPDPQLRVEARQFQETASRGITEYDTGVFFNMPWVNYRKYAAMIKEAQSNLQAAQQDFAAVRTQTLGQVRDQVKKIETAARNYLLFQNKVMPLARQTIESTRSGYESDKTGFLDLITARRGLQEAESSAIEQLLLHQTALVELQALIGIDPAALEKGLDRSKED